MLHNPLPPPNWVEQLPLTRVLLVEPAVTLAEQRVEIGCGADRHLVGRDNTIDISTQRNPRSGDGGGGEEGGGRKKNAYIADVGI